MAFEEWTSRQDKFQSFFGPGVKASLEATEQVQQVFIFRCYNAGVAYQVED